MSNPKPMLFREGCFRFRKKIAAFDFDWTLVRPKSNGTFSKSVDDWQWMQPSIPEKLKSFYASGFCIMVFTNQTHKYKEEQIRAVVKSLDIPVLVAIAFDKVVKKPVPTMFHLAVVKDWDKNKSFFVGDALGRPGDWSDSDKKFAEAVGIAIKTPEQVFVSAEQPKQAKFQIPSHQEVVVLVGYAGSGKSTIAQQFEAKQYGIISSDELKTPAKMIKIAKAYLDAGTSIVVDATNPSKEKRASWVDLAKSRNIPVRCVHVALSMTDAMARNKQRPAEKAVPNIAYFTYRKRFEEPHEDEGFAELIVV